MFSFIKLNIFAHPRYFLYIFLEILSKYHLDMLEQFRKGGISMENIFLVLFKL